MILYLDASAIVKLYLDEASSDEVRRWAERSASVATSRIALAEVVSAITRRRSEGTLAADLCERATEDVRDMWPDFATIDVDERLASDIVARHNLRALDAIHVAAALTLHDADPEARLSFCSFDARQRAAARSEGLDLLEP